MSFQCRLVLAVVLLLSAGLRAAGAQTVMVRSAVPGAAIELRMNGGTPATATAAERAPAAADENGDATLVVPSRGRDTDVQLHVDVCDKAVHVVINEPGVA